MKREMGLARRLASLARLRCSHQMTTMAMAPVAACPARNTAAGHPRQSRSGALPGEACVLMIVESTPSILPNPIDQRRRPTRTSPRPAWSTCPFLYGTMTPQAASLLPDASRATPFAPTPACSDLSAGADSHLKRVDHFQVVHPLLCPPLHSVPRPCIASPTRLPSGPVSVPHTTHIPSLKLRCLLPTPRPHFSLPRHRPR